MSQKGFSLIELMIVVAIVGILAAVAIPSFTEQSKKGRRADAQTMLNDIATRQERHFFRNNQYTGTLADLGITSAVSPEGFYTITLASASNREFVATATARKPDAECATLTLNEKGIKGATGTATAKCW